jgi:Ca2+-binding EF-hand superfamily protein
MSLDKYEFSKAMTDYMLGFNDAEIAILFKQFDLDRSGLIEYDEFLRVIRGPMNANRKVYVGKAFAKLDKDGNGYVDINDITGVYTAKTHPDVASGKKTEQQILLEFLETFETAHNMRNNTAPDHIVTKEEFEEYYNNISASIDDDEYFALMMTNAWNLNNVTYNKGWGGQVGGKQSVAQSAQKRGAMQSRPQTAMSNQQYNAPQAGYQTSARPQSSMGMDRPSSSYSNTSRASRAGARGKQRTDEELLTAVRESLKKRGTRSIVGLGRTFKICDDNGDRKLDHMEGAKAIHDMRVGLDKDECVRCFKLFDRNGDGYIDYDEFLYAVRGEMNQFRQNISMKAFKKLDIDGS